MGITSRIDNITKIPDIYKSETPPCPKSVKIELTGKCNFRCSFCAHAKNIRETRHMDFGLFQNLLYQMREAGVEEIGLFYLGESFLNEMLVDAIDFAKHKAKFPYVFLTTNGSLATPEKMEECFRAGLDSLKFSMNWADEEQFKSVANVKGALYHKALENIFSAKEVRDRVEKETGHRCGLYASYIHYNGEQDEKMKPLVEKASLCLDEVYALPLYSQANLTGDDNKTDGWNVTAGNRGRLEALREPLPCWAVFTEGHITWDGHLSACCFDHDGRFNMGDLTNTKFMDAWNSDKFKALRKANLEKNVKGTACEKCVAYA
jgi:radical SAM protein with 4Fe4S-binding SPASM domain